MITLEIIACSVDDCLAIQRAGAHRIELVNAIELGGITPSLGLVAEARAQTELPIVAMVRPRGGDFCYSDAEFRTMLRDVRLIAREEVNAIITGSLHEDQTLHLEHMRALRDAANGIPMVCHRCFEHVPNPQESLDQLISMGYRRVLTSGQEPTALEGAGLIHELIEQAQGRIEVLPGSGVRAHNIKETLERTGAIQAHGSAWNEQSTGALRVDPSKIHATLQALN